MSLRFFLSYFQVNTSVMLWLGADDIGSYDSISDIPDSVLDKYNVAESWIYTTLIDCGDDCGYTDCVLGIDVC